MRRKILSFFLVIISIMLCFNTSFLNTNIYADEDDTENEIQEIVDDNEDCDKACQIDKATKNVADLKEKLKEAKSNQKEYSNLLKKCEDELIELNSQIDELAPQINELNTRIESLEISIKSNETKVSALNGRVLKRMENAQATMHFNPYLDFLLGSNGFADMLRRVYGIEAINEKEGRDRDELIDIINQLSSDKKELSASKEELDKKMEELEIARINQEALQAVYEEKMEEAEKEVSYYQNLYDNALQNRKSISVTPEELAQISSASGFSSPVPGSSISSGFPYYPASFGGGVHLGIDYAAKIGSNIYAPADGVVLVADDGHCDTYGYLGNSCGGAGGGVSYGGNQVYFMCSVNDQVYALTFSHLTKNSVGVSPGEVILQGDYIAQVGSSGNSTGPHCHIEMFYLGYGDNEDLLDYINKFNNGSYSLSFNCGWGEAALVHNCDNNGYSAPCRLNGSYYLPG